MRKRVKVKDVANQCMVSRTTVRRWIKSGELPAIRLPSGHYRINLRDFKRFLEKHDMQSGNNSLSPNLKRKGGEKDGSTDFDGTFRVS
jgi:excisionase family DNA binding protein